jgi:NADH dehydrogenase
VVLIDRRDTSDFLPLLPDIVGNRIRASATRFSLKRFCSDSEITFINDEVMAVDPEANKVICANNEVSYDFLLVASGSETNFFGNSEMEAGSLKLDSCADALRIDDRLRKGSFRNYVVAGGGYTGIEIATHIRRRFQSSSEQPDIALVELAPRILGNTPDWMREYSSANLRRMNIQVLTGTTMESIDGSTVTLSDGTTFRDALPLWSAGVKAGQFLKSVDEDRAAQGRLPVAGDLCVKGNIFAAGDAAGFMHKGKPLRMAVQFSIVQGAHAAANIVKCSRGLATRSYKPVDLGFIIPMANWRSCGIVLGKKTKGLPCSIFHYIMCVYRSQTARLRMQVARDAMSGTP